MDIAELFALPALVKQLADENQTFRRELSELRQALPVWVDQVEAERLTGLSETSLWRQRKKPDSLIEWKLDRGVRYLRSSLIAHNNRRTVPSGTSPVAS